MNKNSIATKQTADSVTYGKPMVQILTAQKRPGGEYAHGGHWAMGNKLEPLARYYLKDFKQYNKSKGRNVIRQ